jgi:hypothetical protein
VLDAGELARLDAIFAPDVVAGSRYNETGMALVGR